MPEVPNGSMPVPATPLSELRRWQFDIRCSQCRRRVVIWVEELIRRHDKRTRVGTVLRALRCDGFWDDEKCGGKPLLIGLAEVHVYGKSVRKVRELTVAGG